MEFPKEFIAFGSQYYRFPTPTQDKWEQDLGDMARLGFNTIKIWAQWRVNNPREGVYDFSDVERLMDLAAQNGLKAIVNIVYDGAPTWFHKKYPDNLMITCDGRAMHPRTIPHRQVGGAPGPCLHHEPGRAVRRAFTRALAERLKNHPALLVWDLWNEPELTVGLLREPILEDLLCYCDHSKDAFIDWLREKYQTIQALNDAWHGAFGAFDELELPRDRGVFKPMVDWRMFFVDALVEELRLRAEAVRAVDDHPVMAHTVPFPYFNVVTTGSSDYKLAKVCDLFGNSLGSEPFAMATITAAARGKTVINSEIHAVGGSTYGRPNQPGLTLKAFKRHLLGPLARNIRGFQFWQYRAETLGFEAPAWGLLKLDGSPSPWLDYARQVGGAVQRHAGLLSQLSAPRARIAILTSDKNQVFIWCIANSVEPYYKSIRGIFEALYAQNYLVDIVSDDQVVAEGLDGYDLAFAPFPYYMDETYAQALRGYVQAGGTLVAEAFFGGMQDEDGYHATVLPGYGFDEVFGCREDVVMNASSFNDAYGQNWSSVDQAHQHVSIELARPMAGVEGAPRGYLFSQGFSLTGGRALAHFEDGRVAAVENQYGAGRALVFGTLLGHDAQQWAPNARLLYALAREAGIAPTAQAPGGVRVDPLERDGAIRALLVSNAGREDRVAEIAVPGLVGARLVNLMTEEALPVEAVLRIPVAGEDLDLYRIE